MPPIVPTHAGVNLNLNAGLKQSVGGGVIREAGLEFLRCNLSALRGVREPNVGSGVAGREFRVRG